jgi:hypothetical protein
MSLTNQPPPNSDGSRRSYDTFPFDGLGREEFELTPQAGEPEEEPGEPTGRRARFLHLMKGVSVRLGWLGLVALLSLGSAGLVAATGKSPANDARPELTNSADKILSDRLDAGIRDLAKLNDDVFYLGTLARDMLSDLQQLNQVRLSADYQDGDSTIAAIDGRAKTLNTQLECKPWPASRNAQLALTYSNAMVERWQQVCAAIDSVAPLADDWAAMEAGARTATQVSDDIDSHDQFATAALQQATQGRYDEALAQLGYASAALADAQRIDTELAKIGDVSTLTDWLTRTKGMDDALILLWQTIIGSKGRVTPQVNAALKAVNDARALLPDNKTVLSIVLHEMAAGMTSNGISIETAKGQLDQALTDLTGGIVVGH